MNLFLLAILGGVLAIGMLANYTPIVLAAQFGPLATTLAYFRGQNLAVPPRLSAHYYMARNEFRPADVKKLLETD